MAILFRKNIDQSSFLIGYASALSDFKSICILVGEAFRRLSSLGLVARIHCGSTSISGTFGIEGAQMLEEEEYEE